MRKLLVNILCAFVPSRQKRKTIRALLNYPVTKKMRLFAASFSNQKKPNIRYTFGFRCANFVVTVDDKWVFKFPLTGDAKEIAMREKRITDALRPISPLKIPDMEIVVWNGIYVRKYEFIRGTGFNHLSRAEQNRYADTIAKQLAPCLYAVAQADPREIADLKQKKSEKPSIMRGWTQNDLWDNFIINTKNFKIVGFIDWEGAEFTDFYNCFTSGTGCDAVKIALLREYLKIAK